MYAFWTVRKSAHVFGLVDEADCPDGWVGSLDQRLVVSSPISTYRHRTHLGIIFNSMGMLSNWTGSVCGFVFIIFICLY